MINRRLERVNALLRNVIGELLLSKISDPRLDPARVSVTRVEVTDDFTVAKVFVTVMGTEAQQKLAVSALRHAHGHIQELMMRQIQLRNTPRLDFELDKQFKKTLETLVVLQKVAEEIRQRDLKSGKVTEGDDQAVSDQQDSDQQEPPDEERNSV